MSREALIEYLNTCVLSFSRINAARMRDAGMDEEQIRAMLNAEMPAMIKWYNDVLSFYDCGGLSTRH